MQGQDDQDNFIVNCSGTEFAVHTDTTDGEVSLRVQDGTGNNYSKYMTFFTNTSGSAAAERLRIDSSGNTIIGQTTAGFQSKLTAGAGASDEAITILSGTSSGGSLYFADGTAADDTRYRGWMQYIHTSDYMTLGTAAGERLRITSTGGLSLNNGELVERCYINSTAWSTTGTVDLDNGMVQYNSSNLAGTTNTLDIISSAGINTSMATGDMMSVTCITAVNATTAYVNNITIDGIAATESWVGGSAPSDGGGSGVDTYAFNIIKTADATFVVIANQVKTS